MVTRVANEAVATDGTFVLCAGDDSFIVHTQKERRHRVPRIIQRIGQRAVAITDEATDNKGGILIEPDDLPEIINVLRVNRV